MTVIPTGWSDAAHALWVAGQKDPAIFKVVEALNATRPMPRALFAQLGYYTYLVGNYEESAKFLRASLEVNGPDPEIHKNLANAEFKLKDYDAALKNLFAACPKPQDNADVCDLAAAIYAAKGDIVNAKLHGEWSLLAKDRAVSPPPGLSLAPLTNRSTTHAAGQDVISFTLFGRHPRYLRGTLRNALLMGDIYPGWRMRVAIGEGVPDDFVAELRQLDVDIDLKPAGATTLQQLGWRFEVANDPNVNRFMVRDVDSVINVREAHAVQDWLTSGKTFHVMRDWWSHTDPVLAGMWGGFAGCLPDLVKMMADYKPRHVETRNIDQWFLRDCVWPMIRSESCIHDRCFEVFDAKPFPGPALPFEGGHVGQDEIAVRVAYQDKVLAPYIAKLPYLAVKVIRAG
jgi:hypothetical protein